MPQPVIITPPAVEPVSIYQAKQHLRVDMADDDALIDGLIRTARAWAEEYSGRALITQTLEVGLECFPAVAICLPRPPVQSITSITYLDPQGASTVMPPEDYELDTTAVIHTVRPVYGKSWPAIRSQPGAVKVRYVAGFGATGASVPPQYIQAMLLVIGRYYSVREDVVIGPAAQEIPFAAQALLGPSRIRSL